MGIIAWVLYWDVSSSTYKFEEHQGTEGFDSTDPADWGLDSRAEIILVMKDPQYVAAWINGQRKH